MWINDPREAGYRILQPIPVEIRRVEVGDFEASFREANIAMSGSDSNDALQALAAEILEKAGWSNAEFWLRRQTTYDLVQARKREDGINVERCERQPTV